MGKVSNGNDGNDARAIAIEALRDFGFGTIAAENVTDDTLRILTDCDLDDPVDVVVDTAIRLTLTRESEGKCDSRQKMCRFLLKDPDGLPDAIDTQRNGNGQAKRESVTIDDQEAERAAVFERDRVLNERLDALSPSQREDLEAAVRPTLNRFTEGNPVMLKVAMRTKAIERGLIEDVACVSQ